MSDPSPGPDRAAKLRHVALAALSLIALGSIGMFVAKTFLPMLSTGGPTAGPTGGPTVATITPPTTPGQPLPSQKAPGQTGTNQATGAAGQAMTVPGAVGSATPGAAIAPSFDIVRIGPQGDAVMAGRSEPNAQLSIRSDGVEIGHATADSQGAWALTTPLPSGSHALTLQERTKAGQEVASAGSVLMAVPERGPAAAVPPLAVLTAPHQAPRVLQGVGTAKPGQLGLGALDYDARGDLQLSGTAKPGATVACTPTITRSARCTPARTAAGCWSLGPWCPKARTSYGLTSSPRAAR